MAYETEAITWMVWYFDLAQLCDATGRRSREIRTRLDIVAVERESGDRNRSIPVTATDQLGE
jgi:hypothetical protein